MACARASRAGAPTVLDHPGLGRGLGAAPRSPWPASVLGSLDPCALQELAALRVLHGRPGVPPRARRRGRAHPARNRRARPVHHQPAPGAQLRTHSCPGGTARAPSRRFGCARGGARLPGPDGGPRDATPPAPVRAGRTSASMPSAGSPFGPAPSTDPHSRMPTSSRTRSRTPTPSSWIRTPSMTPTPSSTWSMCSCPST